MTTKENALEAAKTIREIHNVLQGFEANNPNVVADVKILKMAQTILRSSDVQEKWNQTQAGQTQWYAPAGAFVGGSATAPGAAMTTTYGRFPTTEEVQRNG